MSTVPVILPEAPANPSAASAERLFAVGFVTVTDEFAPFELDLNTIWSPSREAVTC